MSTKIQCEASGKPKPKLSYSHDAMVDLILQDPTVTQNELSQVFGYSVNWVQKVCSSDAFQARLAERKGKLVDPAIAAALNHRLGKITLQALDIVSDKLDSPDAGADYALEALSLAVKAMPSLVPKGE